MPAELKYPVYIPTKGRPERQITAKALLRLGITPHLVVEDAEHDAYAAANPECVVHVWPQRLMDEYEKTPEMDPHPTAGLARNFAFEHSYEAGHKYHWTMDDNIYDFLVINHGVFQYVRTDPLPLVWHENLADRFVNLGGLCLAQSTFMSRTNDRVADRSNKLVLNTRLYCAQLLNGEMMASTGLRWRRGLNDDTIFSIDILKTRYWCTLQSYTVGIKKIGTSRKGRLAGGMTDFYAAGGFVRKAAELVRCHPDVGRATYKFNRVHHTCDFKQFDQQLIPVDQTR
jgi:hypothetical protein